MLVLTRKVNQEIYIQDHIKVMVVEINDHQVRIGIDAPKNIAVHRKEIYERIHQNQLNTAEDVEKE